MSTWVVSAPERLDVFLTREAGALSRGKVQQAITDGKVFINDEVAEKIAFRLQEGDKVELRGDMIEADAGNIEPLNLELTVLYEDDACMVIDKPAGIAVHPGAGMLPGEETILHGIAFLFEERGLPFSSDAVLVHRLDRDTTGCLLVAKTPEAHLMLQKQFETRTINKQYLAIVAGVPSQTKAMIDSPIGRSSGDRIKMGITRMNAPREAQTGYEVLSSSQHASLILCELFTGRTHQIRVHLQAIGHPLLGDDKYGNQLSERIAEEHGIDSLCLHAWKLAFESPADKKRHAVESSISQTMTSAMKKLGLKKP